MADTQDELDRLTRNFEAYLTATEVSRSESQRDRDYVDHMQWTPEEAAELEARGQAPVVINRIKKKVNVMRGIQRQLRTKPKALPRTPKHESSADSATEALRFIAENNDFEMLSSRVFEDEIVAGYGAAIVEVDDPGGGPEVRVRLIQWDRFYYDPHSREPDFSDAKFMGIVQWLDKDDAKEMFPGKEDEIEGLLSTEFSGSGADSETFDDQPDWVDRARARLRVCQHLYIKDGQWTQCFFTDNLFLMEPHPSPWLDEFGYPDNPIVAQSAYVDTENNRYGEVRAYIWIQDEINHRRSKFLYMMSTRQTIGEEGAVDINQAKRALTRADGHVTVQPGAFFEVLENQDQVQGQAALLQEAKSEIDAFGANAALSGDTDKTLSGKALMALQQGGLSELAPLHDGHKHWERRVYRQMWNRVRQFWTAERWIRVTDDEGSLEWVGLNKPITLAEHLQSAAMHDPDAGELLSQLAATNDPRLGEVVRVDNDVAELDVDIILSDAPNYATIRAEQFAQLAELAKAYGPQFVPFSVMLAVSELPEKERMAKLLRPQENPQQAALAEEAAMMELESKNLDNTKKKIDISKGAEDIRQKRVETMRLVQEPIQSVNVNV